MKSKRDTMRVLHIITGLNQGGAERQLTNMVRSMRADSQVFSILKPGIMAAEIEAAGVHVHSGSASGMASARWLAVLRRALRDQRPDAIIGWMYHGNVAATATRWLGYQGPVLWNVRHSIHDLSKEKIATRCIIRTGSLLSRQPTRIIYNSRTAADQHEAIGYSADRTVVLPNGFDLERFKPNAGARMDFRSEIKMSEGEVLIGVVGRSHPMKNHLGWVKAFKILVDRGYPIRGVMIGRGVDRSDSELHDAIREAGLESKIERLGPRPRPENVYPGFDLLVMPSRWGEGFSNVVGEAMACGVPAVVTPIGDAPHIVSSKGFICESAEVDDIVLGVETALAGGLSGLIELGRRARQRVEDNFSLRDIAQRYDQLIEQVVSLHREKQ